MNDIIHVEILNTDLSDNLGESHRHTRDSDAIEGETRFPGISESRCDPKTVSLRPR